MQAVILAGGLGTRLLPITQTTPKAMIPICGRPFLEYQLTLLRTHGIIDVVLCVGYLGEKIKDYFEDGSRFGLSIRYGEESGHLLGTAGAVKNVEHHLQDEFFVTYGDAYLRLDYGRVMLYFRRHNRLALMVAYKNQDRHDRSNVVVKGRFVAAYDKQRKLPGMEYIDFGVSVLRKKALQDIPSGGPASLEGLYTRLIARRQLLAYRAQRRFYEIGSGPGLAEFDALIRSGRVEVSPTHQSQFVPQTSCPSPVRS
jgi:N-acetyl-alpha-D-muramate 1-phosphate uridylyltransferase